MRGTHTLEGEGHTLLVQQGERQRTHAWGVQQGGMGQFAFTVRANVCFHSKVLLITSRSLVRTGIQIPRNPLSVRYGMEDRFTIGECIVNK